MRVVLSPTAISLQIARLILKGPIFLEIPLQHLNFTILKNEKSPSPAVVPIVPPLFD
jgi:hypothetical protein